MTEPVPPPGAALAPRGTTTPTATADHLRLTDWHVPQLAASGAAAHLVTGSGRDARTRCAALSRYRLWRPVPAPELDTNTPRCADCAAIAARAGTHAWDREEVLARYQATMSTVGAAATRAQYVSRVTEFLAWCERDGRDPRGGPNAETTLTQWQAHLAGRGLSTAAVRLARAAVRRLHLITSSAEPVPATGAAASPSDQSGTAAAEPLPNAPSRPPVDGTAGTTGTDTPPTTAAAAAPARPSSALHRQRIAHAVELLALGSPNPDDPGDRYHPAVLTARWLEELSESSQRGYYRALAAWLGWCRAHSLDWQAARPVDVGAWRDQLTVRPPGVRGAHTGPGVEPARATITKSVVVVSSWYRFLAGGGVPVANPAAAVRRPTPANVSATPALTATENTAWLDALLARARRAGTETAWRDVAHQFLLWDTGLRVTASCLARFEDLHLATRIVDGVPVEYAVLRYRKKTRGRGADWGEVVITPDTLAVLRDYWAVRAAREGVLPERLTGPLLVSTPHGQHPGGRPLDERQVWRRMRVLAGQLGMSFASRVHPHLARATWATLAWEAGVDLIRIRDGLGHSSVSVTERYVRAILSTKDNPGWTIADLRSRSHGTTAA